MTGKRRREYWLFIRGTASFVWGLNFGKLQLFDGGVEESGVVKPASRGREPFGKVIGGVESALLMIVASVGA